MEYGKYSKLSITSCLLKRPLEANSADADQTDSEGLKEQSDQGLPVC